MLLLTSCTNSEVNVNPDKQTSTNKITKEAGEANSAKQHELVEELLQNKKYAQALLLLEKLANQDDTFALNKLGTLYYKGLGVVKNIERSVSYFKKSATLNDLIGIYNLGVINEFDLKNIEEAAYWYKKAAEKGSDLAQFNLGFFYYSKVLDGGIKKALYWFDKAAQNNNSKAQYQLGVFYLLGKDVKLDYKKAREYFARSAAQGNAESQYRLALIYGTGTGVEIDYDYAFKLYKQAAEQNHTGAQVQLGSYYATGKGVNKDLSKTKYWIEKSAEQGHPKGQFLLGTIYFNGLGVTRNREKASFWFYQSALQGYEKGHKALATLRNTSSLTLVKENHAEISNNDHTFIFDSYIIPFEQPYYIKARRKDGKAFELKDVENIVIKYIEPRGCTEPVKRRPDLDNYTDSKKQWVIGIAC